MLTVKHSKIVSFFETNSELLNKISILNSDCIYPILTKRKSEKKSLNLTTIQSSENIPYKDWYRKKETKYSSVLLLCLFSFFLHQSLFWFQTAWMRRLDRRKSPILIGRKSEKFIQSDRYSILHKVVSINIFVYKRFLSFY